MDELRCSGYKGHWECVDEYPDHMVPTSNFSVCPSRLPTKHQSRCNKCNQHYNSIRPTHPVTGVLKVNWKTAKAIELGGDAKKRSAPEWKFHLDWAEIIWGEEINSPTLSVEPNTIPKFKSKKPKFNQGLYKSSPATPTDSSKETESREGPGDVYIFEDEMKTPGLIKIGATKDVDKRLQVGNTWGAFTCLYSKEFKRRFEAEAKIFELLEDYRLYRDKEWFKINTDLAIKTIEGMYELP